MLGSVLVLTLLLLMPSIPAIQYKTIEESSFDDYFKNHFEIEIKDLENNINNISWKFPVLWVVMLLFQYVVAFRLFRCYYLLTKSANNWFNPYEGLKITNPILFLIFKRNVAIGNDCWSYLFNRES